jgi:outer membrane receptor protein involved in Fe transport
MLLGLGCVIVALPLTAQGTTGVLKGTVTTEGSPLPGVTVTISSPALQGVRTTVTDGNGAYNFSALPPGMYQASFELEGMETATLAANVSLARTSRLDADMSVTALIETITVTSDLASLDTREVSVNFTADTIERLPIERTIEGATELAPGISTEGPNDQIMISGAPSYESLYLVNGAVVNENLRGQPQAVYIEDAIAETTILTGNVSAEFGRFTGGVVSTITKQGGNDFSGSVRNSMTNDDWTKKTPYPGEADHNDTVNNRWEATFGGRIIADRLWFFGAGRSEETDEARNTRDTNLSYDFVEEEDRWEIKLTGQVNPSHTFVGSYLDREIIQNNNSFGSITDTRSLYNRSLPYKLTSLSYTGIFTQELLFELQFSEREFAFVNSGAQTTDLIDGTIIRGFSGSRRAWSPTFCGICGPPKARDNEYSKLKGSYLLPTSASGTHNIDFGFEDFSNLRTENNHQGGSGFRLWGNFRHPGDATFIHVDPTESYIQFYPVLQLSLTSDGNTQSLYVNDKWDLNEHWSFNLGLRYDQNKSVDQAGATTADDSAVSPRLSAVYDPKGNGKHRITLGYGEYAAAIDNGVNDEASSAGSPASFSWYYTGPEINGPSVADADLLPTDVVLQQMFDWFYSVNCPGFTPGSEDTINCQSNLRSSSLPGVSTQIFGGGFESPLMQELSVGYGGEIGGKGFFRADYINREWENFYTYWTNLANGTVMNDLGQEFDLEYIGTRDQGISRDYEAIQIQAAYRATPKLRLGGNFTFAELRGNAQTEASNSATDSLGSVDNYPEYVDMAWNKPVRALPGDVEQRANIWATYDLDTRFGDFDLSLLQNYHTGYPYYASGTIDLREISNPGYISPPSTATYYFEGSKDYRTDDITRTDIAVNYTLPVRFKDVEVFLQGDILNLFDESGIEDPTYVRDDIWTSRNSGCVKADGARCDRFNPMTETPIEGVHWVKHPDFGDPTDEDAYQRAFTYRFSVVRR